MATTSDYYDLLGVPRNASDEQIRSAYRRLARQYHPDVNKADDASERFKQITEAYEILTDPQRRQRYDLFGSTSGARSAAARAESARTARSRSRSRRASMTASSCASPARARRACAAGRAGTSTSSSG